MGVPPPRYVVAKDARVVRLEVAPEPIVGVVGVQVRDVDALHHAKVLARLRSADVGGLAEDFEHRACAEAAARAHAHRKKARKGAHAHRKKRAERSAHG